MEEIRKQWAELMSSVGVDAGARVKQFTDADVCKYYLTGLCPHTLFQNTKQYMGPCADIHSDELREMYFAERKKMAYGYEELSVRYLKPHVDECDRKIARQTSGGRCDTQDKASESIEASARREVEAFESKIKELMKEAETLGNEGNVEGSMKVMDEIHQLNMKKKLALEEKTSKVEEARNMFFQKLKPCEACGALLSEKDGENRLNEHFLGRIHLGFEAIRKHLADLNHYITEVAPSLPRYNAGGPPHEHQPIPNEGYQMQRRGPPPHDRRYGGFPQRPEAPDYDAEMYQRNRRFITQGRPDERGGGDNRYGRQPFEHRGYRGSPERRMSDARRKPSHERERRENIRSRSHASRGSDAPRESEAKPLDGLHATKERRRHRRRSISRSRSSRRSRRERRSLEGSPDERRPRRRRSDRHHADDGETPPGGAENYSRSDRRSHSPRRRLSEVRRRDRERHYSRRPHDEDASAHKLSTDRDGFEATNELPSQYAGRRSHERRSSASSSHLRHGAASPELLPGPPPSAEKSNRAFPTPPALTVNPAGADSEEEGQIRSQGVGSGRLTQRTPNLGSG